MSVSSHSGTTYVFPCRMRVGNYASWFGGLDSGDCERRLKPQGSQSTCASPGFLVVREQPPLRVPTEASSFTTVGQRSRRSRRNCMIRRVDNVTVEIKASHPWTKRVGLSLQMGRTTLPLGRRLRSGVEKMEVTSRTSPVFYGQMGPKSYWRYKNRFFVDNDHLCVEDIHALLAARDRRQDMQIKDAKALLRGGMPHRGGIPRGGRRARQRNHSSLH